MSLTPSPKKVDSIIQTSASVEVQTDRMAYHKNMVSFTNDKIPGPVKLPQDFTLNLELIVTQAVRMAGRREYRPDTAANTAIKPVGWKKSSTLHNINNIKKTKIRYLRKYNHLNV